MAKRCFCLHIRNSGLHSNRNRCGGYVGAATKHRKCKPKDRQGGARSNQTKLMDQYVLFYDKPVFRQNKVDADGPVTNQTGFSGRRPWKLFKLSERTFGWTSTTPRRSCRRNCVLCALYWVLCTECCALCYLLTTYYLLLTTIIHYLLLVI